jgi:hypothetical protein
MLPLPTMRMADAATLARAAWRWFGDWTLTSFNPPGRGR